MKQQEVSEQGHPVPGELAVAFATNRPEMIEMLLTQLKAGRELPPDQVIGLVTIIRDSIKLREQDSKVVTELRARIVQLNQACKGALRMSQELDDVTNKLFSDLIAEDDD
jgi:hypothetical protein